MPRHTAVDKLPDDMATKQVDILAIGAHPDDAEIGCGGLLLKMKALGHRTAILDLTTGDMGWGTPEERLTESQEAARILKLDARETLDMGDCRVEDTFENRCKVAEMIRKFRPQIVLAPYYHLPIGRGLGHNDHFKAGVLASQGFNFAHLRKIPAEGEPYQAKAIYYYFLPPGVTPTFIVDVTDHFEEWRAALEAHKTQFFNPEKPRPEKGFSSFIDFFEVYARQWGYQINARYALPYLAVWPLKIEDPLALVGSVIQRP